MNIGVNQNLISGFDLLWLVNRTDGCFDIWPGILSEFWLKRLDAHLKCHKTTDGRNVVYPFSLKGDIFQHFPFTHTTTNDYCCLL